jgi:hypothetical protein
LAFEGDAGCCRDRVFFVDLLEEVLREAVWWEVGFDVRERFAPGEVVEVYGAVEVEDCARWTGGVVALFFCQ